MNENNVNWAIIHNISFGHGFAQQNDAAHSNQEVETAAFFVTGAHPDTTESDIKEALEKAGIFFGDDGVRWKNYFLRAASNWIEGWHQEFSDPQRDRIAYFDLLTLARTDRRITLRLPPGSHLALVHAARERGLSLNQMIVYVLEEWQDRHGQQVEQTGIEEETIYARVAKHFFVSVSQLLTHPIFFVELRPHPQLPTRTGFRPVQASSPASKAIVEVQNGEVRFVGWERTVTTGKFGEAELRKAVEQAVERFLAAMSEVQQ